MTCLAIDMVGARYGGGVVVALGIIEAALGHPGVSRLVVFASPSEERRFALPRSPKLEVIESTLASRSIIGRLAWNLGLSRGSARAHGAGALLCISNAGVGSHRVPTLLYVQQSLPFSTEAMATMRPLERLRFRTLRAVMRRSARRAALVGVQTEPMRETLCTAFHLDRSRVRVFAPARPSFPVADAKLAAELRTTGERTILYVGTSVGYKNVRRLLTAFAALRGASKARLLVASPDSVGDGQPGVHWLGQLDRAQLRAAYEAADLVVMPSLVETVGLPLLEAMSLDVPVVAADRLYARTVCGEAATYFDPLDAHAIMQAMQRVLDDDVLRDAQRQAGRSRIASWATRDYDSLVEASLALAGATGT